MPGSWFATLLWVLISLGFRFYVMHFGQFNKMYGTIGAVIVVLLWFYLTVESAKRRKRTVRRSSARARIG